MVITVKNVVMILVHPVILNQPMPNVMILRQQSVEQLVIKKKIVIFVRGTMNAAEVGNIVKEAFVLRIVQNVAPIVKVITSPINVIVITDRVMEIFGMVIVLLNAKSWKQKKILVMVFHAVLMLIVQTVVVIVIPAMKEMRTPVVHL